MTTMRDLGRAARGVLRLAKWLVVLMAAIFFACVPMGDRVAGSSTEAGNAGGKLSLSDGRPAAGVSVALVAREYRADTGAAEPAVDVPGGYYRTRTGPDGRFRIDGVVPGDYRVVAIDGGLGATEDSLAVRPGDDTALIERVLRPLGGIQGVAKVVGVAGPVHVWVRSKATLKAIRLADEQGVFRLDSLPEGEYDLEPICFTCLQPERPVRVKVGAGRDTVLADTLKLYPSYFQAFPPADSFTVRAANLPFAIGGKTHRGEEDGVTPLTAAWSWDGQPLDAKVSLRPGDLGVQETQVTVDTGWFLDKSSGVLRLVLRYPDTTVARQWRISLDASSATWAMRLVRAGGAAKLIGGDHPIWRFQVLEAAIPAAADVGFWGLSPDGPGEAVPSTVELAVDPKDQDLLESAGPMDLTFILVPDPLFGGRVFRPRRDELLSDFSAIRGLDRERLGFSAGLEPHMSPDGLRIDRRRATGVSQQYAVQGNGTVTETLKLPDAFGSDSLLLFYRRAPSGAGFAWDAPLKGAGKAWVVTRSGRAWRADSAGPRDTLALSAGAMASLDSILSPIAGNPPAAADDADLPDDRAPAYAWYGGRGRMGDADSDPILAAVAAWLKTSGLEAAPAFALPGSDPFRYLSFRIDSSGAGYTGDTLVLERDSAAPGRFREYLSSGSPGRAADTSVWSYALRIEGDSLVASCDAPFPSRLFGKLEKRTALFALNGLRALALGSKFGLPAATATSPDQSGIWPGALDILNRTLSSPAVKLTARPLNNGSRAAGYLYTAAGGLELRWSVPSDQSFAEGWDKL